VRPTGRGAKTGLSPGGVALRLTQDEVCRLAASYREGATVYDDPAELFKIHRTTVSEHLRRQRVRMRRQSLDMQQVDVATSLYEQGWLVAKIGRRCDVDATTVWRAPRVRGVLMRDVHGRER
jgi:hypothetical protein